MDGEFGQLSGGGECNFIVRFCIFPKVLLVNTNYTKMRIGFLIFLFVFPMSFFQLKAQSEFIVEIDKSNGSHIKIDSIPGAKFIEIGTSVINTDSSYFTFEAWDGFSLRNRLFTVDLNSGNVISNPYYPNTSGLSDNVHSPFYYEAASKIIGMHFSQTLLSYTLAEINRTTGTIMPINSIIGLSRFDYTTCVLDQQSREYIFSGLDSNYQKRLYVLDADSGFVKSSSLYPALDTFDSVSNFQLDSNGLIHALFWDNSQSNLSFVQISKSSGARTFISNLSILRGIYPYENYYDTSLNSYSIWGIDTSGNSRIFNIQMGTNGGNFISTIPFPHLNDSNDNIIELQYHSKTNRLYALHWDHDILTNLNELNLPSEKISIYPNPTMGDLVIKNPQLIDFIRVFDAKGSLVEFELEDDHLSIPPIPGLYFIRARLKNGRIQNEKVLVR